MTFLNSLKYHSCTSRCSSRPSLLWWQKSKLWLQTYVENFFYQSSYAYIGLLLFSEFNPRKPDLMGYTVSAEELYMHPNYTKRFDWDFCLIKLSQALVFDRKVQPIGGGFKNTKSKLNDKYLIKCLSFYFILLITYY